MNQSISEESKKKWEKKYSAFKASLYMLNDGEVIDSVVKTMDYILSKALTEDRKELRERVGKKRHYDLEEFDHESKLMSVGFNQAIDQVLSLLEEK